LEGAYNNQVVKSAGYSEKGVSGNIEIIRSTETRNIETFLKTASGFGGCNAAALFVK
jgi:3-oxoacyl-[acyl-carrier-protein] synthase-1